MSNAIKNASHFQIPHSIKNCLYEQLKYDRRKIGFNGGAVTLQFSFHREN